MGGKVLLAMGTFERWEREQLEHVTAETSFGLEVVEGRNEASEWLAQRSPDAMLLDIGTEAARSTCLEARSHTEHAHMPILSIARHIDDLTFADAFSWGVDDVVRSTKLHGLIPRLRALGTDPRTPPNERGRGVIADPDRDRRIVLARVLRNAGYEVKFALTAEDAVAYAVGESFVVFNADLCDAPESLVEQTESARWLFTVPPRQLQQFQKRIAGFSRAAVTDGYAPPENIVFHANEMSRGAGGDQRSSARWLYGTQVNFRGAGRDQDDHGYCYNISAQGLYVRTLAPPTTDIVWLELKPPRTDRLVRLEGEIVWRRSFGLAGGATVPPGFGAKIVDCTRTCGEQWKRGYEAFGEQFTSSPPGA